MKRSVAQRLKRLANLDFNTKQKINMLVISEIAKRAYGENDEQAYNKAAVHIMDSDIHEIIQMLAEYIEAEVSEIKKTKVA